MRDLVPEDEDEDEDDCLILTAAHLFEGLEDGASVLCAPAGPEPKSTDGQLCGTIRRRVPLHHLPSIDVDAAVIKPQAGFECGNHLQFGMPNGIRDLWIVDDDSEPITVRKHGAQTRLTSGELLPVAAAHRMRDVRTRYGSGWWVYGTHDASFASPGDSGAIVVDSARQVVGMVVAVESVRGDEARLRETVELARVRGRSWNRIAIALGVSRQAARQRFATAAETRR